MKLDTSFAKEIKRIANGDGSEEYKRQFASKLRTVNKELSTPRVMELFSGAIREYGRVPVAICVAVSIKDRADRLDYDSVKWADEVLKLWTNKPFNRGQFAIADNLHPSRIEEKRYAGSLINVTTLEK